MIIVSKQHKYSVSAQELWTVMGDFYGIDSWMAGVTEVENAGTLLRRVRLAAGAGELVEELLEEKEWFQRYRFVDPGPIPVANYVAELSVSAISANESELTWTAHFDAAGVPADAARGAVESNMSNSLQSIAALTS